jgi:hypothetical protein
MKMGDSGKKTGVGGNLVGGCLGLEEIGVLFVNSKIKKMALVRLNSSYTTIFSLTDGIGSLIVEGLTLPKAYTEDIQNIITKANARAFQYGGLALKVIRIKKTEKDIEYHPVLVVVHDTDNNRTWEESSNDNVEMNAWVILVCPPGDRESGGISKECRCHCELIDVLNRNAKSFTRSQLEEIARSLDPGFEGFSEKQSGLESVVHSRNSLSVFLRGEGISPLPSREMLDEIFGPAE